MSKFEKDFKKAFEELSSVEEKILESEELEEVREERGRNVDIHFLREVMYSLQSVSIGTQQVLYFAGLRYSKNFLNDIAGDYEECFQGMKEIFDKLNIGTLEKSENDHKKLILKENAIAHNSPEVEKPICYFISGWIAGFLKGNLGKDFIVNEVKCAAAGAENCEFLIRER